MNVDVKSSRKLPASAGKTIGMNLINEYNNPPFLKIKKVNTCTTQYMTKIYDAIPNSNVHSLQYSFEVILKKSSRYSLYKSLRYIPQLVGGTNALFVAGATNVIGGNGFGLVGSTVCHMNLMFLVFLTPELV